MWTRSFNVVLAIAYGIIYGHRIQPIAHIKRSSFVEIKRAAQTTPHGGDITQSLSRMMQDNGYSAQKFDSAIDKVGNFLRPLHRAIFCILSLSLSVAMICYGCCLAQQCAWPCPRRHGNRNQHLHNGRVVYEWDQSAKVAAIYIRPPEGMKKADLDIKIATKYLRVGRRGKPPFLREETFDLVNEQMSAWRLRGDGELQIFLHKRQRMRWPAVLLHGKSDGPRLQDSTKPASLKLPTILEGQVHEKHMQ